MYENRLSERLTSYWNNIRKDLLMPDFSHFNSSAIDDIWQQCVLFTVQPALTGQTPNVSFYQMGDLARKAYGQDMTGKTFNPNHKHFQGAAIVRRVDDLIASPSPLNDAGQFINERSKLVKYRSCLLPFGRDGKVTHIIAGLSWREF